MDNKRDSNSWRTSITEVASNSIRVRGYAIEDLMGNIPFSHVVYLLLKGDLPTAAVGRIIDAVLVSCIDHGATPASTLAARTAASTGAPLNASLAAGLLSINRFHGGAIESCMRLLYAIRTAITEGGHAQAAVVAKTVEEFRAEGKRLPGFGHRVHTADPRSRRLTDLATATLASHDYLDICWALQNELESHAGRALPLNVDGAIAAVLCELAFDVELANLFFMIARIPGLAAHAVEENAREKPMRRIHPTDHRYDGPAGRELPQ